MKINKTRFLTLTAIAAAAWLWAATPGVAQIDIALSFDTEDTITGWSHWWGKPTWLLEFDPTMDAAQSPDSGSMKVTVDWDLAAGDNQFCFLFDLPTAVDGTNYAKLSMDVYVDPVSPQTPAGDFGYLEFGIRHGDWSQNYFGATNLPITPGWLHLEAPISSLSKDPGITNIAGLSFKMWSGDANAGFTGTMVFWVDNVKLSLVPPPPVGTNVVNTFDDASEISQWTRWWGWTPMIEFDPAMDANTNENSGSMKLTIPFDNSSGDNQFCLHREFGWAGAGPVTVDGILYTNLEMDVYVDPSSPMNPSGNFGYPQVGLQYKDWSSHIITGATIPGNQTGWTHITTPLPFTDDLISSISGVMVYMWSGGAPSGLTGSYVIWVDNYKLVAKGSNAPPAVVRPKMATQPVGARGLHLVSSAPDQQWQRQNIRTVTPNCGWLGKSMEFAMTIDQFPSTNYPNYQAQFFFIPCAGTLSTASDLDWGQPNCVIVTIGRSADDTGWASFRYKTNQPNGNSMFWNTDPAAGGIGGLGGVWSSTVEGTWKIKFEEPNITMTGPSGASAYA